ncbi:MAG: transglycosylase SLT domain-containing protein [Anaerolineae bacterium]|nr:transglycosylase SLT domain-containing protein [Anaerolineae bacterium]
MAIYQRTFPQIEAIPTPFVPAYPAEPQRTPLASVHRRMALILGVVLLVIVPLLVKVLPGGALANVAPAASNIGVEEQATQQEAGQAGIPLPAGPSAGAIAAVFTPEVKHWEPQIVAWSQAHGVDPNLAAIIMQIESCGDPQAASYAGAQGLFQVMPFHFAAGEDALDPDTNARRGLTYFVERLNQTNGDIGRAFAGYNGGHVAAASSWDQWAAETQRYYRWSTGIYGDIHSGLAESPTVQDWLQAGGASLCRQAAQRLGLSS